LLSGYIQKTDDAKVAIELFIYYFIVDIGLYFECCAMCMLTWLLPIISQIAGLDIEYSEPRVNKGRHFLGSIKTHLSNHFNVINSKGSFVPSFSSPPGP
jgi:hypothetical protein